MDKQVLDLKDIHLPEPISWWPIASGWWLLLLCSLVLIAILLFARRYYQSKQLNREINAELESIKNQFNQSKNKSELATALSVLLRRSSISLYSEKEVAGLTGEQWLAFLDKTSSHKNTHTSTHKFQSEVGKSLVLAPYLPNNSGFDFDAEALIILCEFWLKSQRAPV